MTEMMELKNSALIHDVDIFSFKNRNFGKDMDEAISIEEEYTIFKEYGSDALYCIQGLWKRLNSSGYRSLRILIDDFLRQVYIVYIDDLETFEKDMLEILNLHPFIFNTSDLF